MKTSRILLAAAVTFCMTACNEDAQFDKELYKKVINEAMITWFFQ